MQNMILAVGPSTPAARACGLDRRPTYYQAEDNEEGSSEESNDMEEDADSQIMEADQDQAPEASPSTDGDDESDEESEESEESGSIIQDEINVPDLEINGRFSAPQASQRSWTPLIRHESCINTACWLDTPWRLSLSAGQGTVIEDSWETPTQLITSGDDHMVKFWDVRHSMGCASPQPGGWDVFTPFSTQSFPSSTTLSPRKDSKETSKVPPGAVIPLASISSGHWGNVFHVTPVPTRPGLVLTCGADGQLRSCSVDHVHSSNLIMRPMGSSDDDSDSDDYHSMRLGLAYSHVLLTESTGLLCSDRGLFRFDIRVAPRNQSRQPFKLIPSKRNGWRSYVSKIKSCAVWSPSLGTEIAKQGHLIDSNYVFAGGTGEEVHLFDLRMETSGEGSHRVVERYRPRALENSEGVSVCGLDVSKDGKELLVSYESDQIYTFPIFNQAKSPAGPELGEIDRWSSHYMDNPDDAVDDLASYGAHLNRFTFLKSAKYAGPNDEYICTGSDSGHAWIYRKSDGTVASLLSADSHVCNGVVPHPTLPAFVTYGIDSTAKVWRATLPVQSEESLDGDSNFRTVAQSRPYHMSPIVKNPEQVQQRLFTFDKSKEMTVFPDYIPTTQEILCSGRFMPNMLWAMVGGSGNAPRIGNALRTLPNLLRSNRYECYRAVKFERDGPIAGPLGDLSRRIAIARLQHQADQLNLLINNKDHPYLWRAATGTNTPLHPADMVPDFPSDWIQWDAAMDQQPQRFKPNFLLEEYPTVESRKEISENSSCPLQDSAGNGPKQLSRYPWLKECGKGAGNDFSWPDGYELPAKEEGNGAGASFSADDVEYSRKVLYYTALLCKDGGNEALKSNLHEAAARRYDKAIQYCAVAFFAYEGAVKHVPHLTVGMSTCVPLTEDGEPTGKMGYVYTWCPLLRVWISCHLNLALLFLKSGLSRFQGEARNQAEIALRLLAPYTEEAGKVYFQETLIREPEPEETYREARQLQAKAFFRLGCAEMEMGDHVSAVKALEASIASTDGPVDPIIQKRLSKAKIRSASQKKRNRRKFELALSSGNRTTRATEN